MGKRRAHASDFVAFSARSENPDVAAVEAAVAPLADQARILYLVPHVAPNLVAGWVVGPSFVGIPRVAMGTLPVD